MLALEYLCGTDQLEEAPLQWSYAFIVTTRISILLSEQGSAYLNEWMNETFIIFSGNAIMNDNTTWMLAYFYKNR